MTSPGGGGTLIDMRPRLLVVDDSALFRDAARDLLAADGYDVVGVAVDGQDAVDSVRRQHPEIVILDVALPDLDGFAVAERLRALPDPPAVVLVSSRDWSDLERRIAECGACGFLAKDDLSGAEVAALVRAAAGGDRR